MTLVTRHATGSTNLFHANRLAHVVKLAAMGYHFRT